MLFAIPELLRDWRWGLSEYGPFCFMDELLYRLNAESIFRAAPFRSRLPPMIMSENLFAPLLCVVAYLAVSVPLFYCGGASVLARLTQVDGRLRLLPVLLAVWASLFLIILARSVLFGGLLYDFADSFTKDSFNNPDVWGRDSWWILLLIAIAAATPLPRLVREGGAGQ